MKTTLKKMLGMLPYIMLLVAFILIISLTVSLKKGQTPTILGRAFFLVVSPSMEDTINVGDVIFVKTNVEDYSIGDIITFKATFDSNFDGQPEENDVTHRIIDITIINGVKYYTTKGDNNSITEPWETNISSDQIIGKYIGKSGLIGTVYQFIFAKGLNLVFILVILVFLTIGGMEMFNIIKQVSMQKEKALLEEKERLIQIELEKLRQQQKEKDES